MHDDPFDFDRSAHPPLEIAAVDATGEQPLPEDLRERVAIYTPHDGGSIPPEFRLYDDGTPRIEPELLKRRYVEERDWGANLVAEELAAALALSSYGRSRIARVLLDFNRFPGSTPVIERDPLDNLAIGPLFKDVLRHREKTSLLADYYDAISERLEEHVANALINVAVHTYDETHSSATKRAHLSVISVPLSYQREARMTFGIFDPLYPDRLAESTCSRILRDRISLNLERSGFRVAHNHPYAMPDGSIEVRAQVWFFFRYLRKRFEAAFPETCGNPAYEHVWTMLLDTNLRLAEAEVLRSYLHRFRKSSAVQAELLGAALDAYSHVRRFLIDSDVIDSYRRSPDRPSSLGIEVRKDLLCTFDPETGWPRRPTREQRKVARKIGLAIAGGIRTFFDTDREVAEL